MTAVDIHIGLIDIAVVDVAAAEQTAGIGQKRVGRVLRVVLGFLLVALVNILGRIIVFALVVVVVADVAVIQRQVCCAIDGTALATTVGITLNSGDTGGEASTINITDDHVCLAIDIAIHRGADFSCVVTYITQPSAAIDVTAGATFDVSIGRGSEAGGVGAGVVGTHSEKVVYSTGSTGSIDVLDDRAAEQRDIRGSIYVAAQMLLGRTVATAIGVVHHRGAFLDADVGVVTILPFFLFCGAVT